MNTTYFLNLVAGNVFKTKTSPAIPTAYYLGLSTTAPSADGSNVTEVSGGSYARVDLTGKLSEPVGGIVANNADSGAISFPQSTANWGNVTHFLIYNAKTGGNLLMYGALDSARDIKSGTTLTINKGDLQLRVSNP